MDLYGLGQGFAEYDPRRSCVWSTSVQGIVKAESLMVSENVASQTSCKVYHLATVMVLDSPFITESGRSTSHPNMPGCTPMTGHTTK